MLPAGRHSGRCGRTARGSGDPATAWPPHTAVSGVVALCRWAYAPRSSWIGSFVRPCPRAYLQLRRDQSRDPSLRPRSASRPSQVLRSPRTPAAQCSISPSAYSKHLAATTAAQTGLSCSAQILEHVPLPVPREDSPGFLLRARARRAWPSPWHERLGPSVVNLTRLQDSLDVAARVLAPSVEAFDTPLGPGPLGPNLGACYRALRRLPGRDLHPLDLCSGKPIASRLRQDATWRTLYRSPPHRSRSIASRGCSNIPSPASSPFVTCPQTGQL